MPTFVEYIGFHRRAGLTPQDYYHYAKPTSCFQDNVDYIGRYVNSCSETITKTPQDCQLLCQDDPKCNFFVWIKDGHRKQNQCCFKRNKMRKMKRPGMISGPKYCPGNKGKNYSTSYRFRKLGVS